MSGPNVYVIQVPERLNIFGSMVPKIDLDPARRHGTIVILLSHGDYVYEQSLAAGLREFNPNHGDSLLAMGDPVAIAMCGAILGRKHDSFTMLKWDKKTKKYDRCEIHLVGRVD